MPTSGKQWRQRAVELHLPSGNTVMARPISGDFVLRGMDLPDTLTGLVVQILDGRVPDPASSAEDWHQLYDLANNIMAYMFVEPRMILNGDPSDDELVPADVDDTDRFFVLNLIGKGAALLESFRPPKASDVEGVDGVADERRTSE